MTELDPHAVVRLPMARAGIRRARHRADGEGTWTLYRDGGALDLDTLHRLVESAEALTEGRSYPGQVCPTWFGTTVLTFDLTRLPLSDTADRALAERLAGTLMGDARARRVVDDRLYRELARMLGSDTPYDFDVTCVAVAEGTAVRLTADLEAPLDHLTVDADNGK